MYKLLIQCNAMGQSHDKLEKFKMIKVHNKQCNKLFMRLSAT